MGKKQSNVDVSIFYTCHMQSPFTSSPMEWRTTKAVVYTLKMWTMSLEECTNKGCHLICNVLQSLIKQIYHLILDNLMQLDKKRHQLILDDFAWSWMSRCGILCKHMNMGMKWLVFQFMKYGHPWKLESSLGDIKKTVKGMILLNTRRSILASMYWWSLQLYLGNTYLCCRS